MEDTLKKLLDAELRAQALVQQAFKDRDLMVEKAQEEARSAEERFTARIPELRASFLSKADERADQTIAELQRRYEERCEQLRSLAEERRQDAAAAAVAILLDVSRV